MITQHSKLGLMKTYSQQIERSKTVRFYLQNFSHWHVLDRGNRESQREDCDSPLQMI